MTDARKQSINEYKILWTGYVIAKKSGDLELMNEAIDKIRDKEQEMLNDNFTEYDLDQIVIHIRKRHRMKGKLKEEYLELGIQLFFDTLIKDTTKIKHTLNAFLNKDDELKKYGFSESELESLVDEILVRSDEMFGEDMEGKNEG